QAIFVLVLFTLGNVALQLPIGILADAWDRRKALMACAALSLIGTALLPLALDTTLWLGLLLFVWGGVAFGTYALSLSLLGQTYPKAELASANAVFIMVYELGSVVGPVVSGSAMDAWDPHGFLLAIGLAGVIFLALAWLWHPPARAED